MKIRLVPSIVLAVLTTVPQASGSPPALAAGLPPAETELEPVTTTLFGERVLLFMENPRLVQGEEARFLAHLTVLDTGEPVRAGTVTLAIGKTALTVDGPKRDGLFTPAGSFAQAGRWPARLTVTSEQVVESLDLGLFEVFPSLAAARTDAEADTAGDAAGVVPFLLEQQWRLKLLLAQAGPLRLVQRLVVPARVILAEGASAVVASPTTGRLLAPSDGVFPRSGEHVQAGQVLALVEPPISATDAAQLRALGLSWDLEALDVERRLAEAEAQLGFAASQHARMIELQTNGLATRQQVEQAERDLSLAQVAIEAAEASRKALQELRGSGDRAGESSDGRLRLPLLAPISGVIISEGRVLGESLEAGAALFRIVDGSRLWIEARVSEFDLPQLDGADAAIASFPGLPGVRLAVQGIAGGSPFLLGPEIETGSRTLVLRAALPGPVGSVRPGMLADFEIAVRTVDAAVAIPVEAVVMDQGLPTVYVMLGGEEFQRRDIELGLRDGDVIEVRSGLEPGERVATRGAATIRIASLSPSSFGAGHAH